MGYKGSRNRTDNKKDFDNNYKLIDWGSDGKEEDGNK